MNFDDFCRKGRRVIITYNGAHAQAVWPLTEDYAKTMLILYKPGVKRFGEYLGPHETYVSAFRDLLNDPTIRLPTGLKPNIQRAATFFKIKSLRPHRPRQGIDNGDGGGGEAVGGRHQNFQDEYVFSGERDDVDGNELGVAPSYEAAYDDDHDPYIINGIC